MHNALPTYLVFSFTAPERREVKPGGEKQILPPLISIPCSVPTVPLSHCPTAQCPMPNTTRGLPGQNTCIIHTVLYKILLVCTTIDHKEERDRGPCPA